MNKQQLELHLKRVEAYRDALKAALDETKTNLNLIIRRATKTGVSKQQTKRDLLFTLGRIDFLMGAANGVQKFLTAVNSEQTATKGKIPDSVGGFGSSKTGGGIVRKLTAKEKVQQKKLQNK